VGSNLSAESIFVEAKSHPIWINTEEMESPGGDGKQKRGDGSRKISRWRAALFDSSTSKKKFVVIVLSFVSQYQLNKALGGKTNILFKRHKRLFVFYFEKNMVSSLVANSHELQVRAV
jgi:hypothetical protein